MSGNQEKITRHTKRQKIQFEETKEAQEPNTAGMLELSDQEFKTNMINNVRVLWIKYTELKKNGQCMQRDGNLFFWPHGKRDLP